MYTAKYLKGLSFIELHNLENDFVEIDKPTTQDINNLRLIQAEMVDRNYY